MAGIKDITLGIEKSGSKSEGAIRRKRVKGEVSDRVIDGNICASTPPLPQKSPQKSPQTWVQPDV